MIDPKKKLDPVKDNVDLAQVKKSFSDKHKPLSDEDVRAKKTDMENARKKYSRDAHEVEKNLLNLFNRDLPIIDTETDTAVAYIMDVPYFKILNSIPMDIMEEFEKPNPNKTKIYSAIQEGKFDQIYEIMADYITIPKHDKQWWKENATEHFKDLVNEHIAQSHKKMDEDISFLQKPIKD